VTTKGVPLATDWSEVDAGTTAADGSFVFAGLRPDAAQEYRAVFSGDPNGAIVSVTRQVTVRAVVTFTKPVHHVVRGHRIRFHGTLRPALSGTTVVVDLNGPGHRSQKVHAAVGRSGTWSVTVPAPRKTGAWSAVATWHGSSVVLGDHSASRGFRVVR
jgi:hypothetical protein